MDVKSIPEESPNYEPWHTQHRLKEAMASIYVPRPVSEVVPRQARDQLYDFAARTLGDVPVRYLEFGVAGGKSMRMMTERFTHLDARFFGFDCFEGIPEYWKDKPVGSFSMQGKVPVMTDTRVSLIRGYFQDSLPDFISTFECPATSPVLVHYDADLYSSTLFILSTLWHRIREYHFLFDEFMSDEIIAFHDFAQAYPVDVEFLCGTAQNFPTQLFGRLKRRTFAERLIVPKASV
jgi:hypothetical protein